MIKNIQSFFSKIKTFKNQIFLIIIITCKYLCKHVRLLIVMLLIAAIIFLLSLFCIHTHKKLNKTRSELRHIQIVLDSFKVADHERAMMQKTLLVTYPVLSECEAKYYSYIFQDFSRKYKIDWCIYPAKIRIESNFNPTLISGKKAKGMCQLMEGTAREQADKLNITYISGVTEWNEIPNMVMGCNYLSEGIKDSGIEFGLRRYYSGNGKNKTDIVTDYYNTVFWEYQKIKLKYQKISEEEQKRLRVSDEYQKIRYIYKGVLSDE